MAVKQEFSGDASKLAAELARIIAAYDKVENTLKGVTKESEKSAAAALKEAEARKKATAEAKEAVQEAKRLEKAYEQQAKEVDRLNAKIDKQHGSMDDLFAAGTARIAGAIAGWASLGTAIQVVTAGMEKQKQITEKSFTEVERVAKAQATLVFNMSGASQQQIAGVDARIKAAAAAKRVDLASFYETVAQTSAATGGDIEAAIRGASASAPLARLTPEGMPVISSAAAEIAKNTGLSEERSLGLMLQYGGVARQPDTAQFAAALPEAMAAGAGASSDRAAGAEWAMERMAALSVATGDTQGRRSATAIANLAVKMEKFFTDRPELAGGSTPAEREAFLRANPELAKEFMAGLGGEITSYIPIREMFREGSDMTARLRENEALISAAQAQGFYERTVAGVEGGTPELALAGLSAESRARTGQMMSGDTAKASRAQAADIVQRYLEAGSDDSFTQSLGAWIAQQEYSYSAPFGDPVATGEALFGGPRTSLIQGRRSTSENRPADPAFEAMLEELRRIRQNQEAASGAAPVREE